VPQTALMGYEVQTTGTNSGTWGSVLNDNMISYVDLNFAGLNSFSLSSSNVTLTATQARNQMTRCSGVLLANITIAQDVAVLWNGIRCFENLTTGSFTVTLSNGAGTVVIPQGRRALVFLDTTNGPRIIGIAGVTGGADPIPVGSKTLWYNTAAPTGWSAVALNDYGIKVVTAGLGGVTSGSVAYSTFFGRTTTDSHTLSIAEMPSHNHTASGLVGSSFVNVSGGGGFLVPNGAAAIVVGNTGGGDGHTHDIDCRVQTAAFTLCEKS
jgi:hypothetical protein